MQSHVWADSMSDPLTRVLYRNLLATSPPVTPGAKLSSTSVEPGSTCASRRTWIRGLVTVCASRPVPFGLRHNVVPMRSGRFIVPHDHDHDVRVRLQPGHAEQRTHDYVRHGTTTLFAALEIATGRVTGACKPRHRHQEFLAFLKQVAGPTPTASCTW